MEKSISMDGNELFYDLIIDEKFQQYVISKGDINPNFPNDWLKKHPADSDIFEQAIIIVEFLSSHKRKPNYSALSQKTFNEILSQIEYEKCKNQNSKKNHYGFLKVAAIIMVIVGLTFLFRTYLGKGLGNLTHENWVEVRTIKGEREHFMLPDSSEVWLNSGSILSYPEHFKTSIRNVKLNGEAFFQVKHLPSKPFIVTSGDQYQVKVLGTTFDVNYDENSTAFETTLFSGSVLIYELDKKGNSISELKLEPGEKAFSYGMNSNHFEKVKISTSELDQIAAWKNNILLFKDATFNEIALHLENWYGIEVQIEGDDLLNERFTGTFYNNESISEVLAVFERTVPIEYNLNSDLLIISKIKFPDND